MSAYSTIDISRDAAIRAISRWLEVATNEEISFALFALTCNITLDNYIVHDECPQPGDKFIEDVPSLKIWENTDDE